MLDFLKFRTFNQMIINCLVNSTDFERLHKKGNYNVPFQHKKYKIKLECRKSSKNLEENEFTYIDIHVNPHYHFNKYMHNGNSFTPENCKQTLKEICMVLHLQETEYNQLQLVNLEYGINIIPEIYIKNLIAGIFFHKKTPFQTPPNLPYFKITDATPYKQIKAYAKGLQFLNFPKYVINTNTFRFEVKSREAKNIRKLGIYSLADLFNDEVYPRLGQSLIDEWDHVLMVNLQPDLTNLNPVEIKYITETKKIEFWIAKMQNPYRNCYAREVKKYYNNSQNGNNLHHKIKVQILDKIFNLLSGANSTQATPIKSEF